VIGLSGYAFRVIRNAEDILPDHDAETPAPKEAVRECANTMRAREPRPYLDKNK
jgi:hypothetical protein